MQDDPKGPWPEKVPAPRHDANGVDVTNIA